MPIILNATIAAYFLAVAIPLYAQKPPEAVDLSLFPAQAIDDVLVPVPSEIFIVLDK